MGRPGTILAVDLADVGSLTTACAQSRFSTADPWPSPLQHTPPQHASLRSRAQHLPREGDSTVTPSRPRRVRCPRLIPATARNNGYPVLAAPMASRPGRRPRFEELDEWPLKSDICGKAPVSVHSRYRRTSRRWGSEQCTVHAVTRPGGNSDQRLQYPASMATAPGNTRQTQGTANDRGHPDERLVGAGGAERTPGADGGEGCGDRLQRSRGSRPASALSRRVANPGQDVTAGARRHGIPHRFLPRASCRALSALLFNSNTPRCA